MHKSGAKLDGSADENRPEVLEMFHVTCDNLNLEKNALRRMYLFEEHMVTDGFVAKLTKLFENNKDVNLKTPAGFIAAMDIKFETHELKKHHVDRASQPFPSAWQRQNLDCRDQLDVRSRHPTRAEPRHKLREWHHGSACM
eukprot:COSAG01_NODE_9372_length_2464_cov_5.895560_3_plen_141_part_00